MKFNIQRSNVQFFCVQNSDNASYTTLCCCYELNTSAHPSPCCCCNMMTASSALPSPLISRSCKRLSTLLEYLETMQILTIPVCTAKIYPVQLIPPNLVTQYTWCWCTKNTLVPICTESPRTKCVQLASTCLPRVHPVLLRPPYSSPEDQRRRWQCNRFCSNPAWRQSSELGYPGKDNHKLIIAKIRFFLLTKGRSVVKEQVWDFLCCVVGKQVVWWQCKANKTGSSLLLQMDTPIQPAVVIMRYDKCEKYNKLKMKNDKRLWMKQLPC